jgi:nicotinamide-nucleotide amidase
MIDPLMIDQRIIADAEALLQACRERGILLATAESCTGGLLAATLTAIPGSSDVIDRGFVTYSNAAKSELLGVPVWLIERHGAVSEDVARAMVAVAVTGIAGPSGGTAEKPIGLVHLAVAVRDAPVNHERLLLGDIGRAEIRRESVRRALALLASLL